jgi:hypothetical protein
MTNTSVDCIERKDKRIWRKYNPSLVKRIDVLIDTSFLNTWKNDLERENEGKVGRPYEYPEEFFLFLSSEIILSTKSIITGIYAAVTSPNYFFIYKYPKLVGHFTKDGTPYITLR